MKYFAIVICSLLVGVVIGSFVSAAIRLTPTETVSPSATDEAVLLHAIWNNDIERVNRLFDESKLNVDVQLDTEGLTGLMVASQLGYRVQMIQLLLAHGASVSARAKNGNSAVHFATHSDDLQTLDVILAASKRPSLPESGVWTPLHEAAGSSAAAVVKSLLNAGYDVNASGPDGLTPLMVAAGQGSREVVEALVKAGANLQSTNKSGNTAMDFAKIRASRTATPHVTDVTDLLQ